MKNYVCFVNDHSGSMRDGGKAKAAAADYNVIVSAVKDAATREMLDTVVSVVGIGLKDYARGGEVLRQVVVSNPHVLKPITDWPTPGGTPLYDGIGDMIALCESLPDATQSEVSFLVQITTDGEEMHSKKESKASIASKIQRLQATGRWTFVARIPRGNRYYFDGLGIPSGNIVEWDNTAEGLERSTVQTKQAMSSFYSARSAGATSSTVFYADASKVNTSALVEINNKVSLYVVDGVGVTEGMQIRDFVLSKRSQYLKGAAFYQLTKTEPRVTEKKLVIVRDRATGKMYSGQPARTMVGLPQFGNARLHPGDHKNYDIFIQSESVNRKLAKGTGLVYWEEQGTPFTQEELEKFLSPTPTALPPRPAVVQLPAVPVSTKPTKSPIPVTPVDRSNGLVDGKPVRFYDTRTAARLSGKPVKDLMEFPRSLGHNVVDNNCRWFVYL